MTFRWMTKSSFWRWIKEITTPLYLYNKDSEKDIELLWKILNNWINADYEQKTKLEKEYFEDLFDDNYKKWIIIFNYVDFMIEKQLKTLEIKNNFKWLSALIKFRNENDLWYSNVDGNKRDEWLSIWEPIREWNIEELEKLKITLKSISNNIKKIYENWHNKKEIITLINNSEQWIKRESSENINKFFNNEENIQWKLNRNSIKLHDSIFNTISITKRHELESTWQIKQYFYEYSLRNWIYENKEELKIIIIDDVQEVREKIISLLPKELDEFNVQFDEFDNLQEIKEHLTLSKHIWINIKESVFYILDNNFFYDKEKSYPTADMWVELYNFIKKQEPKLLDQIAIFSSYEKSELILKFGENIKTISWKWFQYADCYHIWEISNWIKWKMWKESNEKQLNIDNEIQIILEEAKKVDIYFNQEQFNQKIERAKEFMNWENELMIAFLKDSLSLHMYSKDLKITKKERKRLEEKLKIKEPYFLIWGQVGIVETIRKEYTLEEYYNMIK